VLLAEDDEINREVALSLLEESACSSTWPKTARKR
jgi:CheY-like chemotaxis protein